MANKFRPTTATVKDTPTEQMPATKGMTSPKSSIGATKTTTNTTTAPTNRPTTALNKAKSIPVGAGSGAL